jgi:hypothetical protein
MIVRERARERSFIDNEKVTERARARESERLLGVSKLEPVFIIDNYAITRV